MLELTEHAEEALMKQLQSAVVEGEPLDLVQIRAKHERKDMGKAWFTLAVLLKYDGTDMCEAVTVARGANQYVELGAAMPVQHDLFVWRVDEIRAPRSADKRASVQCLNNMTCIVQYMLHDFDWQAVNEGQR